MATAMIRCLRKTYPLAQIDMVVRSDFFDLIRHNPHLDRKLSVHRNEGLGGLIRLRKEINRQRYDLIYDAHRSLRTFFLMPFLKAEHKAYFHKPYLRRALALTFKWKSLIRGSKRMLERYIEPLNFFGVHYDGLGPEVFPETKDCSAVLQKLKIDSSPDKWVGIIPSAQWPGKRWAPENFRTTLELLLAETKEKFLVFGGPADQFCQELVKGLPPSRVVNTQGKLSLLEVFQIFEQVKCCVSNDTGLMHVADALGIPNVLIFGPTNADMGCMPYHPKSRILEHDLWCRPCSKNGEAPCLRSKRLCLELTTPEKVAATTKALLRELNQDSSP